MAEKRFSELTTAGAMTGAELLAMSQETLGSLLSVKSTLQNIANWFAVNSQYASALDTTDKTLCGAINELKQLISLIPQFSIEVVQTLPTEDISETTIYLVPSSDPEQGNYYEEYIYVNNTWELVGTTAVDLSAYYTKLEVDGLLAAKANTSDVTAALALKEAKSDLDDDVTDIVVGLTDEQTTAPGNPVTLTTVQEGGAKSALVTFAPKQSGTGDPSPSNIRPISGWDSLVLNKTGVNQWDEEWESGAYDSSGAKKVDDTQIRNKNDILVFPNTTYYFKILVAESARILFFDENKEFISRTSSAAGNHSFTTPVNCRYVGFQSQQTTYNNDISINYPSTDTDYHAYQGQTHTATFPDTVYGGSYDFVSGSGQSDVLIAEFDKNSEWTRNASGIFYVAAPIGINDVVLCNSFKPMERGSSSSMTDLSVRLNSNRTYINFKIESCDTLEEFLTAINDLTIQVAYLTAAPTPIALTPADVNLLKGLSTVWTDGDTVQIKYSELPNGNLGAVIDYIKKLEARVKALES